MKKLAALALVLMLLGGLCARGDVTVPCVLTPEDLFDTVTLYKEAGSEALGEYKAYAPAELLNWDGDWALVSIGGLTGFVAADKLTPVPNPNAMPDSFFRLTVQEDITVNGYFMPQFTQLGWLGTTAQGNYHVSYWDGDIGWQSGFVAPGKVQPAPLRGYGGAARETPLFTEPNGQVLMTLLPGLRMDCQIDPDWSLVTTEAGHQGYVVTQDIAFSLALTQQAANCPVVTFKETVQLLADDRQTPLTEQVEGSRAVQLAQDGHWALILSGDGQFTGWVKADRLLSTGQMRNHKSLNGLPVTALAIAAPQENSLLEPGLGLLVQGETAALYQTPHGFVDKKDVLLIPVAGEESRLCTLTLKEGETFAWNGETFTGPGAYDMALFPDEEAPQGAAPWQLGEERLSLSHREEKGSGRILGLHCYQEIWDGCTLYITGLGENSLYTLRTLGGKDLGDRSLLPGEAVYETLPLDGYLTFTNCSVLLLPGNG